MIFSDGYEGQRTIRLALQLLALTFPRPGELRQSEWPEVDTKEALWIIPAHRTKLRREHRIPLSRQAVEKFEALREITGGGQLCFPSIRSLGNPLSDGALNAALRAMGIDGSVHVAHGFRSSASSLLNERSAFSSEAIERALAQWFRYGSCSLARGGNQMLLRRVIAHLRKQEWTAIAIDFVIVVVGVFVGIQVSNWNAARVERAQERVFISRLYEDMEESVAGQTRDLDFLAQQLSDQAVILASLDTCAVAPENAEAFQRGIQTLGYINPPRFYRRTIDEMGAAGETDIIQSGAIKARLAQIVALVEWRAAWFQRSSRVVEHYRYIVEEQVRYDFNRTFPDRFLGETVGVDFDIRALCRDAAIGSAVSAIGHATRERQRAYAPILDQYRAFMPMLEEEASRRWQIQVRRVTAS